VTQQFFPPDDWMLVEEGYQPHLHALQETVFAVGNGYMGVRGTPEEGFSGGPSHTGTYLPLLYDEGRIGYDWTRVNFPTRSTFVVTAPNWTNVTLTIDGMRFDPREGTLHEYRRALDLRDGVLTRELIWEDLRGRRTALRIARLASLDQPHLGALSYALCPLNYTGEVTLETGIDAGCAANCTVTGREWLGRDGVLMQVTTNGTGFHAAFAMRAHVESARASDKAVVGKVSHEKCLARTFTFTAAEGQWYTLEKLVAITTSRDPEDGDFLTRAALLAKRAAQMGFAALRERHAAAWARFWAEQDVELSGDPAGQQGIRYSLACLHWNYAGADPRLNVGAKGISGPGYGGLYFWDSEVYLLPYYTYTNPEKARNLLMQRYLTLPQARARARQFRYDGALYPWTTLDGTDCAIPWEYGMLEQHVSIAIPYGVWMYVEASGDDDFLWRHGAEMVLETARFWASRVVFNERRGKYVINAVTGPDEYAMVVNNNCYTNTMAKFVLEYALEITARMPVERPQAWAALCAKIGVRDDEAARWADVAERMYLPFDRKLGIHPQDDAFLDMDPIDVASIPEGDKPLLAHWPWERLIRTQVLKQPDVLLLMFLLSDRYPERVKRANYLYYEPKTIHDSSLSPCIHSILAAELGFDTPAFDYYRRTARLDLDDVNGNAAEGVHIANMAGSWMSIVQGFAGMRMHRGKLAFAPHLPAAWGRVAFTVRFRKRVLRVEVLPEEIVFTLTGRPMTITVGNRFIRLSGGAPIRVPAAGPVYA
jgi:alpha,alpha-trehalose phosphorylase